MPWWLADRDKPSTGKASGVRLPRQPDPVRECNAGIAKIKAQEGKDEPDACLYVLDTVDGEAQPSQYGCHHCRLGRSSARPSGCQAFLRLAAFLAAVPAARRQAASRHGEHAVALHVGSRG